MASGHWWKRQVDGGDSGERDEREKAWTLREGYACMVKLCCKWTAVGTIEGVRTQSDAISCNILFPCSKKGGVAKAFFRWRVVRPPRSFGKRFYSPSFYSCVELQWTKEESTVAVARHLHTHTRKNTRVDFGGNRPVLGVFQQKPKAPLTLAQVL